MNSSDKVGESFELSGRLSRPNIGCGAPQDEDEFRLSCSRNSLVLSVPQLAYRDCKHHAVLRVIDQYAVLSEYLRTRCGYRWRGRSERGVCSIEAKSTERTLPDQNQVFSSLCRPSGEKSSDRLASSSSAMDRQQIYKLTSPFTHPIYISN